MGIMNKIKGILFDEDEIEVTVDSDELPERSPKEVKKGDKKQTGGFIDYNSDEEEDTIKEIIIPKEEETTEIRLTREKPVEEPNKFDKLEKSIEKDFPSKQIDEYLDRVNKEKYFDDVNLRSKREEKKVEQEEFTEIPHRTTEDIRREYNIAAPVKKHIDEVKDYKKMVKENESVATKKPFTVTPVISPVYGILDKNYTADEVVQKRELINKTNSGVKPRMFGPVSYNDQPLPVAKRKDTSLKEDLVELNTTINELISDSVTPKDVQEEVKEEQKSAPVQGKRRIVIEEEVKEPVVEDEDDQIIQTENYDDYESTSIENEYIGNNDIEDAFEPTGELNTINKRDQEIKNEEEEIPTVDFESIVSKPALDEEDVELDNTIETDLFNLIDSMYKSEDKDEEEE